MTILTPTQIKESFDRDGYVVIPSFLNPLQVAQVQSRMDEFVREVVPYLPAKHKFYEDKDRPETLKQLQDLSNHDPFFGRMFFSEQFVGVAELLLGSAVQGANLQWFNKPAKIGSPTPPHQDGYYFMLEPNEAVTMWLALDEVDEANGCVRYIPGSHRKGIRSHARTTTLGFSQGISDYADADYAAEVPIHAKPGDLLVHHSLTIHRADGNTSSDRSRRALGFVYYARHAREDFDRKAAYQKSLTRELAEAGKL
ncbi:MAG: phytanoyl-CoA dioxygenase family protein [Phycisphaerales bacterium]|jgi:phytanoyl-CoA hydroxylase|nr:phytanoyl-CoA dioxygenase family protein [Phycisphaerales bacterium]